MSNVTCEMPNKMQAKGSLADTIMLIEKPFLLYLIWKMDKIVKESNSIVLAHHTDEISAFWV